MNVSLNMSSLREAKENITPEDVHTTSPTSSNAKKALAVQSPEGDADNKMGQPLSPTDKLLSPCTRKLMGAKRHKPNVAPRLGSLVHKKQAPVSYTLGAELAKRHYPYPARRLPLVLGSSSKNRREVLEAVHWEHRIVSPDIDEKAIRCENPHELPLLIAKAKADAVIKKIEDEKIEDVEKEMDSFILLTCDQIVLFNGDEVREKPSSAAEAETFLKSYSEKSVTTIAAVVATHYPSLQQDSDVDTATVHWKSIDDDTIQRVISRGEIFSSAGGFRIEDPELQHHIRRIDGTVDSVMGMPLAMASSLIMNVITRLSFSSRSEESL